MNRSKLIFIWMAILFFLVLTGGYSSNAIACDYYASPTGTGNGTSASSPFKISNFWSVAGPGKTLCLLDGVYTGSSSMIVPPAGLKGTSLAPIKITATNDGQVTLDGEGVRRPVDLANDNDWFILEGFNAHSSSAHVIRLTSGSDNNVVRRVVAWDASLNTNDALIATSANTGNLFEDIAGFGVGRYIFAATQGGNNATFRRAWGSWEQSNDSGPKNTFGLGYRAYNDFCENCIGTWNTTQVSIAQPFSILRVVGNNSGAPDAYNTRYMGSIAYMRKTASYNIVALGFTKDTLSARYENVVTYSEITLNPIDVRNPSSGTCTDCSAKNTTMIGADSTPSIGSQWITANNASGATVGAVPNIWNGAGSTGARVCKRYVNGSLTNEPLWPWPMDQRINAALKASGRNPADYFRGTGNTVTSEMETIFGPIPSECKGTSTVVNQTPPPAPGNLVATP